ncbi:flavodoxin domain-containing protein [uncultured Roseobacter sp.]|uniref:flavodoxin domain-containing protein n=1 Tax=uncultured Roseobacter sp. TaxID=114847 RepID=UPI002612B91D|nr:flavodoxin domain-containing protein [uncultured Roseobacter sp.]
MSILLVYATVEGQTGKVADAVQEQLRTMGCEFEVMNTAEKTAPVTFKGVDKVILAAPVHERRHPETFEVFLTAHRQELQKCETLLLSVSLSAAFPEGMEEAKEYVTELKMRTELDPSAEVLVAGAVRSRHYDYYATQVLRHVVLRDQDYNPAVDEHEFTDWEALAIEVAKFTGADERVS